MRFEWDAAKAAVNLKTRGVSFNEAIEVFSTRTRSRVSMPNIRMKKTAFISSDFQVGGCSLLFMPKDYKAM